MAAKNLLTRAEFQVMSILWNLPSQSGFTTDILAHYDAPKPAYTTLATFLKILTTKGFVTCKKQASKLHYTAKVDKKSYARTYLEPLKDVFFDGNIATAVAFVLDGEALTAEQAENIAQAARSRVVTAA
ncbi:MAG: BlaI/MecI/CopY family transcriptional regulator [Bacteroidaceae bacterium]|nr:BlaI/MecI/CopY family transcriptional regulator [Bacteroidaceae bacterium]